MGADESVAAVRIVRDPCAFCGSREHRPGVTAADCDRQMTARVKASALWREGLLAQARAGEVVNLLAAVYGRETFVWTLMTGALEIRDAALGAVALQTRVGDCARVMFGG